VDVFKERLNKMYTTDLEVNREKFEAMAEQQDAPNEEVAVETIGALKDQCWDQQLAVGCRQQPKKQTQGGAGSQKKLAAVQGQLTHHVIPARSKGCGHKGPMVKKRRRKSPEYKNGIWNRSLRDQLCLESKKIFYENLGQTIGLEIVKRTIGSPMRIRKTSVKTLWRSRPPPSETRSY
jgi:hypothetical protein